MCVRTCDGYYWPLHYPVARGDLTSEAALCQATCDSPTRLYTRANPGTEAEEMVDEEGKSYGASPTAFLYRKNLTNGCTCRPMPWSVGERARHEGYALAERERKLRAELADAGRIAASYAAKEPTAAALGVPSAADEPDRAADIESGPPLGPAERALLLSRREPAGEARLAEDQTRSAAGGEPNRSDPPDAVPSPMGASPARRQERRGTTVAAARGDRAVRRVKLAQESAGHAGGTTGWFSGQPKYTYPGDPPGRY